MMPWQKDKQAWQKDKQAWQKDQQAGERQKKNLVKLVLFIRNPLSFLKKLSHLFDKSNNIIIKVALQMPPLKGPTS
jgi:hypothetical protein